VTVDNVARVHTDERMVTKRVELTFLTTGANILGKRDGMTNRVPSADLELVSRHEHLGSVRRVLPFAGMLLLLATDEGLGSFVSFLEEFFNSGFHANVD